MASLRMPSRITSAALRNEALAAINDRALAESWTAGFKAERAAFLEKRKPEFKGK